MSEKQKSLSEKSDTNLDPNESQKNRGSILNESYNERTFNPNYGTPNRSTIAVIVYLALLLDNVLLTVIVPILPDYLATINNRTEAISTLHYASLNADTAITGVKDINTRGGLGILGAAATAHHLAYRNLNGTAQHTQLSSQQQQQQHQQASATQQYQQQQQQQHLITKHPIPGKSMVNFSLIHIVNDDNNNSNNKVLIVTPINEEKQRSLITSPDHIQNEQKVENNIKLVNHNNNNKTKKVTPTTSLKDHSSAYENLASENGSIGVLLAMKALVQLIFNPIVGNMSTKYGYRLPIVLGTFCLLISSLVFAVGESYIALLIARSVQGIGSACIGVCGMSLVAQHYPEEERRSKVMGIILGSIALGVLLGYPFGGILYDLFGKSAPFIILSTIIFVNLGMQLVTMDLSIQPEVTLNIDQQQQQPKWRPLLESKMILAIVIAIWFSTSTMAILEPCLPIWLMQYLKPTKWQLGTVFIPDSIGYFVGTNFFGSIAFKYGQIKVSCISLILVGISSILIPCATTVAQLLLPHFGLGLGIGIIDAALVPLLATFVDATLAHDDQMNVDSKATASSHTISSYGTVYAIQQTSVSLAYCLAPLIGGELAQAFGFSWLMRIVGIFNIIYGPILVYLYYKYDPKILRERQNEMLLSSSGGGQGGKYKQLYNSMDTE